MNRTRHIITEFPIYRSGQQHHFQIPIPRDAKKITGIKVSAKIGVDTSNGGSTTAATNGNGGLSNGNSGAVDENAFGGYNGVKNPITALFGSPDGSPPIQAADSAIGRISLWVAGEEQEFYASTVSEGSEFLVWGTNPYWEFEPYGLIISGGYKDRRVEINACQELIMGYYADTILRTGQFEYFYDVKIYLTYQTKR